MYNVQCASGNTEKANTWCCSCSLQAWPSLHFKQEEDTLANYITQMVVMGFGLSREGVMR